VDLERGSITWNSVEEAVDLLPDRQRYVWINELNECISSCAKPKSQRLFMKYNIRGS